MMKTLLLMVCLVHGAPQQYEYDEDEDDIFSDEDEDYIFAYEEDEVVTVDPGDTVYEDVFGEQLELDDLIIEPDCRDLGNKGLIFDYRKDEDVIQDCNKNVTCSHYTSQGFACAPYWQCQNRFRSPVITDGEGETKVHQDNPIDLRSNLCVKLEGTVDASDEKCETEGHVCCKDPDVKAKICPPKPGHDFDQCGRTSQKTKITNLDSKAKGSAQPGEFTHMCIIYRKNNGVQLYHGGASLIAKNKVITVAHKFWVKRRKSSESVDFRDMESDFMVRCGEYNVRKEKELIKYQETDVVQMYFHPLYNPRDKFVPNNLLILRTKQNFIYQDHIGPVCLPSPMANFESDEECSSSGWGKTQFGGSGHYSDILKKINMKIVRHDQCNKRIKTKIRRFKADKSMVCVLGVVDREDTCTGDGGSPHVCKRDGKWVQVGAVAWGIGCGSGIPSIYASIPDAMCWIDQIMTCVPLADTDINNDEENIERSADDLEKPSINVLGEEECRAWRQAVPDIGDCQVTYGDEYYSDYEDYDLREIDEE